MALPSSDATHFADLVCSTLGLLGLPRAFFHRQQDRFVAWNSPFLNALGLSEEEIRAIRASEILLLEGEGVEINGGVQMIRWKSRLRSQKQVGGNVIAIREGLTFVMLDAGLQGEQIFESGRQAGIREEQSQLNRFFQHKLSPNLLMTSRRR